MKKILALALAAMMVLALCACGSSSDTAAAPAQEAAPAAPAQEAAPAAPAQEAAPAEAPAAPAAEAGDDFEEYKAYVIAYTTAGAPTEDEAAAVAELVNACATPEEIEAVDQLTVLYENSIIMTYADWLAAGKPAAQTDGMGIDPNAGSGEASGEGSGEPTAEPAA